MDILSQVFGGTDSAALFGANVAPSRDEIEAGQTDAQTYGNAINKLIGAIGLRRGMYVSEQPLFGPLMRMMTLAGWTFSGSGFFSAAFYKGGLCLKLSLRGSGDAAFDYLDWAKDKDMAGLPKVYTIGRMAFACVALMERYSCAKHLLKPKLADHDVHLRAEYDSLKDALEHGEVSRTGFASTATARAIRSRFENGSFDMHIGNVMVDRDGNLIITDPLGRSEHEPTNYGGYSYYSYPTSLAA